VISNAKSTARLADSPLPPERRLAASFGRPHFNSRCGCLWF
jgi:hypothetical protein